MKISEMSLEELQDYALKLENDLSSKDEELTTKDNTINELTGLNKTLQLRNNELFRRVEQQSTGAQEDAPEGTQNAQQTCEDFAKNKFKELIK